MFFKRSFLQVLSMKYLICLITHTTVNYCAQQAWSLEDIYTGQEKALLPLQINKVAGLAVPLTTSFTIKG